VALIKLDPNTAIPVRNEGGLCVRCSVEEPGEAIGKILDDPNHPGDRFEGYTDLGASERKILRNVFATGDAWFRTGDLMRKDHAGYFYFVDRIGDTYRWKGENVSTMEAAELLTACPGVVSAIVYGVEIPGTEGRAGMAAIVANQDFELVTFRQQLVARLPSYTRPVFLRIRPGMDVTETFKPKKQELVNEGYDPGLITDPIYFYDRTGDALVRLDRRLYKQIRDGNVRL
jgi:fatty-acyl-CoA synthase